MSIKKTLITLALSTCVLCAAGEDFKEILGKLKINEQFSGWNLERKEAFYGFLKAQPESTKVFILRDRLAEQIQAEIGGVKKTEIDVRGNVAGAQRRIAEQAAMDKTQKTVIDVSGDVAAAQRSIADQAAADKVKRTAVDVSGDIDKAKLQLSQAGNISSTRIPVESVDIDTAKGMLGQQGHIIRGFNSNDIPSSIKDKLAFFAAQNAQLQEDLTRFSTGRKWTQPQNVAQEAEESRKEKERSDARAKLLERQHLLTQQLEEAQRLYEQSEARLMESENLYNQNLSLKKLADDANLRAEILHQANLALRQAAQIANANAENLHQQQLASKALAEQSTAEAENLHKQNLALKELAQKTNANAQEWEDSANFINSLPAWEIGQEQKQAAAQYLSDAKNARAQAADHLRQAEQKVTQAEQAKREAEQHLRESAQQVAQAEQAKAEAEEHLRQAEQKVAQAAQAKTEAATHLKQQEENVEKSSELVKEADAEKTQCEQRLNEIARELEAIILELQKLDNESRA